MLHVNREVPLTTEQRNWLRANTILPTVFLAATLVLLGGMFVLIFAPVLSHPAVKIFAGIAALLLVAACMAVALHIRNNRADLRRGTTTVARARLQRKHRTSRAPYTFYAVFEGIGQVIVMGETYERLAEGETFEVTFSPHTRKAWSVR
jgi:hypothetical protein